MPSNQAAWLKAMHKPLEVGAAPWTEPGPGEILVRNHAIAVNPVDWMIPYIGALAFSWVKRPAVLGSDVAGEVVAVGAGVTEVKVGDRVLAMATGVARQRNRASEGAFQAFSICLPRLTTIIPNDLAYADAAVVPLGLTTAACGLFQSDNLGLPLPSAAPQARNEWVIVTGGATSVGCNAIQLAVAAGYGVVTTASPRNFDYVKSLGAAHLFDYRSPSVQCDIVAALEGKTLAGALAIGAGSVLVLLDILPRCQGRRHIANCSSDVAFDAIPPGSRPPLGALGGLMLGRMRTNGEIRRKTRRHGVTARFFDASSVIDNEIGPAIYRDYLGPALAEGRFRAAPRPIVAGHGLGAIQTALDRLRAGVSAAKVVVTLD